MNVKFILSLAIILNMIIPSQAQDSTFNYLYTSEHGLPEFYHCIVHNDTIVGIGSGLYPVETGFLQGIIVSRFDSSGVLIDSTIIKDPFGGHYGIIFQYGKILKSSKGGYLITTLSDENPGGTLIKLSSGLQIEWIKTFFDPETGRSIEFQQPIEIEDGYILYGTTGLSPTSPSEPVIYRIDEQGDVIWFNYYGNPNISDRYWGGGELINDSTFVVGGVGNLGTFIQLIDFNGDVLDSWYPGLESPIGFLNHIQVTVDGNVIILADKLIEEAGGPTLVQLTMSKLSYEFEIQFIVQLGIIETVNTDVRLWDIQPTSDGNYIAAGQSVKYTPPFPRRAGWIFKFSPQGDSIWSHIIDPMEPNPLGVLSGQYGGIGELTSGSYVAGGYADNGDRFMWLTKVTTDGCLEAFCPEINVISNETSISVVTEEIEVIPNPTNGSFKVAWPSDFQLTNQLLAILRDISGQQIWQKKISLNEVISMENLPNGLYFLEIQSDQQRWVSKIIKQ